jgi:AraC family transcriptional regulator, alkane utilization regulator
MTETPPSFAGTPDRAAPAAGLDVLSQMLRAVRLTGSVFFTGYLSAPFGVISPKRWDENTPLARLRHISVFHLVTAGRCTIELAGGARRDIAVGDLLLLPFTDEHRFWNGSPPEFGFAPDLVRPAPIEGMETLTYGGGGEETRLVCGYLESSEFLFTPVFRTLPQMLVEQTGNERVGALMASTAREIASLAEAATLGSQMILGRMMELLFVEVLRRHASRLPAGSTGWLAALNDPILGRALALVHADPGPQVDRRGSRARSRLFAHGAGGTLQCAARPAPDRLRHELAHPARRGPAAQRQRQYRRHRRRHRLRVGSRVQPRLQAGDRADARPLAQWRRRVANVTPPPSAGWRCRRPPRC